MEKVPRDAIEADMAALGLSSDVVDKIIDILSIRSLDKLSETLGDDFEVVARFECMDDLQQFLDLRADVPTNNPRMSTSSTRRIDVSVHTYKLKTSARL